MARRQSASQHEDDDRTGGSGSYHAPSAPLTDRPNTTPHTSRTARTPMTDRSHYSRPSGNSRQSSTRGDASRPITRSTIGSDSSNGVSAAGIPAFIPEYSDSERSASGNDDRTATSSQQRPLSIRSSQPPPLSIRSSQPPPLSARSRNTLASGRSKRSESSVEEPAGPYIDSDIDSRSASSRTSTKYSHTTVSSDTPRSGDQFDDGTVEDRFKRLKIQQRIQDKLTATFVTKMEAFRFLDRDHDGFISREDIRDALQSTRFNFSLSKKDVDGLFKLVSKSGRDPIAYPEFCRLFQVNDENGDFNPFEMMRVKLPTPTSEVEKWDGAKYNHVEGFTDEEIDKMVQKIQHKIYKSARYGANPGAKMLEVFRGIDDNGDGYLSKDELEEAFGENGMNVAITEKEIDVLLRGVGRGGYIDYDTFVQAMEEPDWSAEDQFHQSLPNEIDRLEDRVFYGERRRPKFQRAHTPRMPAYLRKFYMNQKNAATGEVPPSPISSAAPTTTYRPPSPPKNGSLTKAMKKRLARQFREEQDRMQNPDDLTKMWMTIDWKANQLKTSRAGATPAWVHKDTRWLTQPTRSAPFYANENDRLKTTYLSPTFDNDNRERHEKQRVAYRDRTRRNVERVARTAAKESERAIFERERQITTKAKTKLSYLTKIAEARSALQKKADIK